MRMISWISVAVVLLAAGWASARSSEERAFRCSGGVVEIGDSEYEVREKCGPPRAIEPSEIGRRVLVYDFGPETLVYYVYLSDGKVEEIRSGDYGTEAPAK